MARELAGRQGAAVVDVAAAEVNGQRGHEEGIGWKVPVAEKERQGVVLAVLGGAVGVVRIDDRVEVAGDGPEQSFEAVPRAERVGRRVPARQPVQPPERALALLMALGEGVGNVADEILVFPLAEADVQEVEVQSGVVVEALRGEFGVAVLAVAVRAVGLRRAVAHVVQEEALLVAPLPVAAQVDFDLPAPPRLAQEYGAVAARGVVVVAAQAGLLAAVDEVSGEPVAAHGAEEAVERGAEVGVLRVGAEGGGLAQGAVGEVGKVRP